MNKLTLRPLLAQDQLLFERAFAFFPKENDFEFVPATQYQKNGNFLNFLELLANYQNGVHLPAGHVPSTMLFAFSFEKEIEKEIVGRVSIRHSLNDYLLKIGGHVGYGVLPEFRNQGYASAILRLTLDYCHSLLKLKRILLTCNDHNIGSIRTIEKNGGLLENTVIDEKNLTAKRRYWIDLENTVKPTAL